MEKDLKVHNYTQKYDRGDDSCASHRVYGGKIFNFTPKIWNVQDLYDAQTEQERETETIEHDVLKKNQAHAKHYEK